MSVDRGKSCCLGRRLGLPGAAEGSPEMAAHASGRVTGTLSNAQETSAMPILGQVNNNPSTSLDPGECGASTPKASARPQPGRAPWRMLPTGGSGHLHQPKGNGSASSSGGTAKLSLIVRGSVVSSLLARPWT